MLSLLQPYLPDSRLLASPRKLLPMPSPQRLIIATRESALALWQAHHIRDRLAVLHPGSRFRFSV